jgi:hypothetical protein
MEDILHKWSIHYLFFIGMNGIQTKISDYIITHVVGMGSILLVFDISLTKL